MPIRGRSEVLAVKVEPKVRNLIVLAIVAMWLAAIAGYVYLSTRGEDSSDDALQLQLDSLVIEKGTWYPWLWINSTDGNLKMYNSCGLEVQVINMSTNERAYTIGTGGNFRLTNGTWSLTQQLDLQYLVPGNYTFKVFVNCTFYEGVETPTPSPRHGIIQGNVSMPLERPVLPRVIGITLDQNDENGTWHYRLELSDPDMDGDAIHFGVADKSGTLFYVPWTNSTDNSLVWVLEGYFELSVPFQFSFVFLKDKDGPHSETNFMWSGY
jgi:hypothetical protein